MKKKPAADKQNRVISAIICMILVLLMMSSVVSLADTNKTETIRVGFFAFDGYHEIDENGLKSGYGYDFLTIMKRYADVSYEYVGYDMSWSDMQQMLLDGEIDMVTSAHKTADREALFDFSLPIGTNTIHLSVRADDNRFIEGDYDTYDAMTIGLIEGSSSNDKVEKFAEENHFTFTARYYPDSDALEDALVRGEVEAVATSSLRKATDEKTIAEFNTEYFYAIVKKGNTALLDKINAAITAMNSSEGDWKNTLYYNNYEAHNHTGVVFSQEEAAFIATHSNGGEKIVIAFDNEWDPFTYKANGVYTGILPDVWSSIIELTGMEYEVYDSKTPIIDECAILNGEADIYMGYCFDAAVSENNGFVESAPIMSVGAAILARKGNPSVATIGVSDINPRLNVFLNLGEGQKVVHFANSNEAVKALENGEIDAVYLYAYEGEMIVNQDKTGMLIYQIIPNISVTLCAVADDDASHVLIGIVSKCLNAMSQADLNTIVARNLTLNASNLTFIDYLKMHPVTTAAGAAGLAILILGIFITIIKNQAQKKHSAALQGKIEEISDLNTQLQDNQARLEESAAEQEAQLEEITALNSELEERQAQLEEASAEQEAQIEEVTSMNSVLEDQRKELREANEKQRLQLNEIERLNELFKETQDHGIRSLLDQVIQKDGESAPIDHLVQTVGEYFHADRAYVFERDKTNQYTVNTYEWCAEGVMPEKDNLQEIPICVIDPWIAEFRKKGSFYISCNDEYAEKEPMVYEVLEPQGITNLMAAPMIVDGDIIGFIGVDNPKENIEHELYLSVAATAINHERRIILEKEQEELYKKELEESREAAQTANKAKTDFLFSMSHDIRTPMNAIIGYANLMKKYPDDKERGTDYLDKIISSSDFLLDLINNVLEVARIESGKMALDETTWNTIAFNDSLFAVFAEEMRQKSIAYTRTIDIRNEFVFCDSVKVREIFLNLLSNALKYTPAGGNVHMELKELPSDREGYALMQTTISDTGIGMSAEYLPHLFEEFSRERTVTENKIQGTGLGMPIVKKLVDLMGGTISVTSELGEGTTFVVQLYHRISSAEALQKPVGSEHTAYDFTGKHILLAEDNDLNAEIALEILKETGAEVDRAEDGIICIDMLRKSEYGYYNLILMDIQMPNLNGYKATEKIRRAGYGIPIIAMTANAFEEDKQEALRAGMNGHLAKPINVAELMKALAGILG